MSHSQRNGIAEIGKVLIVTVFKTIAIVLAFVCKISGLILTKMGEVLEKLAGHGNH